MQLRPYQSDIIERARAELASGKKSLVIVSPVASGKTVLISEMISRSLAKGKTTIFVVHRTELLEQSVAALESAGVSPGIISAKAAPEYSKAVQVASIQTLVRRLDLVAAPDLMVWDEAHHVAAKSWATTFNHFKDSYHILLTATPIRLDGKGLKDFAQSMVMGPSTKWLIENKYLSGFKLFAPMTVDLSSARVAMGDFLKADLAEILDKPTITGDVVSHYLKIAPKTQAIVFCVGIDHSKKVAAEFARAGMVAAHVDGTTPADERRQIMKDFAEKKIQVVCNVDLFGEGLNVIGIETVVLVRPTHSLSLYIQMIGRGLRVAPGKPHLNIIDAVGNVFRHGLPDDDQKWTLTPTRKKKKLAAGPEVKIKQCPVCFGVHEPAPSCPCCGHVYEVAAREVEQVEGELRELTAADRERMNWVRRQEVRRARTKEELEKIARERGYKPGWVFMQMKHRGG